MKAAARSLALLLAASPAPASTAARPPVHVSRVDPLTVEDDDFARHRDPAEWQHLHVDRIEFTEERASWRLWRIEDRRRRRGPLWFVPHDDEDAGFDAALVALRHYGGTLIAVDSGVAGIVDSVRRNRAVAFGPAIDPNRNFHDGLPLYPKEVLAAINGSAWPIIALHTNAPGYDAAASTCPPGPHAGGEGGVNIELCSRVLTPSPSRSRAYPFDDTDTLAYATHTATETPHDAFCADRMVAADFNVQFERVVGSDGSLSNWAVLHHLAYLNFETQDAGHAPEALAAGRDRLLWMIDRAMAMCAGPSFRPAHRPRIRFR